MTHSWKKCWTDGQTGDWWQRFHRILCRMESNNVKGIQTLQKRIKLFEYSKSSVTPNGLIFLKDTHSWMSNEKKWEDKFNGKLFFSHIKTNSCGVLICYRGTKKFDKIIKKKQCDKSGRIFLFDLNIDGSLFVLINIMLMTKQISSNLLLTF